jgi:hypothetical protein
MPTWKLLDTFRFLGWCCVWIGWLVHGTTVVGRYSRLRSHDGFDGFDFSSRVCVYVDIAHVTVYKVDPVYIYIYALHNNRIIFISIFVLIFCLVTFMITTVNFKPVTYESIATIFLTSNTYILW